MSNFLSYINDDILIKTETLKSLPDKTKTNVKNKKQKLVEYKKKYEDYSLNVKKYIEAKAKSIELIDKNVGSIESFEQMETEIRDLKRLGKLLNPLNTYYEKLGFDGLLFKLSFYADFDFVKINSLIKDISDVFNMINVNLTGKDFWITSYVNKYMVDFYDEIHKENPNYFALESTFEHIYWVCPNIIKHIELNFRVLIRKHEKEFIKLVESLQGEEKRKFNIFTYEECMKKLKTLHYQYTYTPRETLKEIVDKAIKDEIEIGDMFDDSKARIAAYNVLVLQDSRRKYDDDYKNNHENLMKLRNVLIEYKQYDHFMPFVNYSRKLMEEFKLPKPYKEIVEGRDKLEVGISMINKVIHDELTFRDRLMLSGKRKEILEKPKKQLMVDVVNYADKLYDIYLAIDAVKFLKVVKGVVTDYVTLDDFLNVFRDFDYFKKKEIKGTFEVTSYDELMKHVEEFDEFCNNPNNLVIPSVPVYQEYNVAKVIVDKYRINNFNLTEEIIKPANIDTLLGYIDLFLRSTYILQCGLSIRQVWFVVEADKILNKTSVEIKQS